MGDIYTSGAWLVSGGHEQEFIDAWRDFVAFSRTMPGAGTFRLLRDVERADHFISLGDWESLDAQRAWKETSEFMAGMRRVREHAELVPAVYELVAEVG